MARPRPAPAAATASASRGEEEVRPGPARALRRTAGRGLRSWRRAGVLLGGIHSHGEQAVPVIEEDAGPGEKVEGRGLEGRVALNWMTAEEGGGGQIES